MAGPTYYDATINIALNDDWSVPFVYGYYAPDGVTIMPIDLTGSLVKMEIRVAETDHEAIVAVDSDNVNGKGGVYWFPNETTGIPDPTTGQFVITITRERLAYLFPGVFVADIVRLMPNGLQERIVDAQVFVAEGTTR